MKNRNNLTEDQLIAFLKSEGYSPDVAEEAAELAFKELNTRKPIDADNLAAKMEAGLGYHKRKADDIAQRLHDKWNQTPAAKNGIDGKDGDDGKDGVDGKDAPRGVLYGTALASAVALGLVIWFGARTWSNGDSIAAAQSTTDTIKTELAKKADKDYVDTELASKAEATAVADALAKKADKTELIPLKDALAKKADKTELAKKADKDYVDTELAGKADASVVTAELAKKADKTELAGKADATALSDLTRRQRADRKKLGDKIAALEAANEGTDAADAEPAPEGEPTLDLHAEK